jgi:hypothetical protein
MLALGIPLQRGCEGDAAIVCPAVVETPARRAAPSALPAHVIYLNRGGATLKPGPDDAAHDTSSIVQGFGLASATMPAAGLDDATWQTVMQCVSTELSRFNITLTDQRPAQPGYLMLVFGGSGDELGVGADSRGDAPQDKANCQTVEGAVAFVFTGKLSGNAADICEVAAHELGHVFSVDHALLAADAMSYLPFTGHRGFVDLDAPCGESQPRACSCGRDSQNPVQILLEKLGPAPSVDSAAPSLSAEANVPRPGFIAVTAHAIDPSGIGTVTLTYRDAAQFLSTTCGDGQTSCIVDGSTYTFTVGGTSGRATYTVAAIDTAGNPAVTLPAQIGDDVPASAAMSFTLDAQVLNGVATPSATISGKSIVDAKLYWTDARGVTSSRPLCSDAPNQWSRGVQLAAGDGPRSFVIVATDSEGHTAASPAWSVKVGP